MVPGLTPGVPPGRHQAPTPNISLLCALTLAVCGLLAARVGASPAFSVDAGPCEANGTCVSSSNYPASSATYYAANERCVITVQETAPLRVVRFDTEEEYDTLSVGSNEYSGSVGPDGAVVHKGQQIIWSSDDSKQKSGWSVCAMPCPDAWCVCQPGKGNYTLSANCVLFATVVVAPSSTLRLATTIAALKTVGPSVLSARGSSSLFEVYGSNLTLVDVVLRGGKGANGGCLFVSGNAQAHLIGTTIRGCQAVRNGGAVFVQGMGASIVLEGAAIEECIANKGAGGGIFVKDNARVVVVANTSILRNNSADEKSGGGLYIQETGNLTITGSGAHFLLEGNSAHDDGGGLYADVGATVLVSAGALVEIKYNEALGKNGGGLYIQETGNLTITGSGAHFLLEGNSARDYGGGLYADVGATVLVSAGALVEIKYNEALEKSGGGAHLDKAAAATITGSGTRFVLENNTAHRGGGLDIRSGSTVEVLSGAIVEAKGNTAHTHGGGVRIWEALLTVLGSGSRLLLKHNSAHDEGGGLYAEEGATLTITGSGAHFLLEGNSARDYGGGLYADVGATVLVSAGALVEIKYNEALEKSGGGAHLDKAAAATITGSGTRFVLENNTAHRGGPSIAAWGVFPSSSSCFLARVWHPLCLTRRCTTPCCCHPTP